MLLSIYNTACHEIEILRLLSSTILDVLRIFIVSRIGKKSLGISSLLTSSPPLSFIIFSSSLSHEYLFCKDRLYPMSHRVICY